MKTICCVCGEEIDITIDDFIEVANDVFFCDDCATAALEFIKDSQLRLN